MAMKSTWNRTCFINPPGCCIYRLPYEQVGPDIKGSRWVVYLLSVSWNWHPHTASGQRVLILFISHGPWRSLPSMFLFGTIEDTPSIIRTRCIATVTDKQTHRQTGKKTICPRIPFRGNKKWPNEWILAKTAACYYQARDNNKNKMIPSHVPNL